MANSHRAISHRDSPPQLWGDFVYMVPPFLAYYSVASNNLTYFEESVRQCELYHELLITDITTRDGRRCHGLWHHIVNDPTHVDLDVCCADPDIWLSNAWAVTRMLRLLAIVLKWTPQSDKVDPGRFAHFRQATEPSLLSIITEMLNCTMAQSRDPETSLLRNYLDGEASPSAAYAFGDVTDTALMTSALYRLAVLLPDRFATEKYLSWADQNYGAVASHVDREGKAGPVTTPYEMPGKKSLEMSPEGQSMVLPMAMAWRDYVKREVYQAAPGLGANWRSRYTNLWSKLHWLPGNQHPREALCEVQGIRIDRASDKAYLSQ